jgi:ubiquinone/menaquinone biosynthesis C-methylase UbiE
MSDSHKQYYEIEDFWNHNLMENSEDHTRVIQLINHIPADVETILEVGCGNGAIVNTLRDTGKYSRIVGIDLSETALKYVKVEKYVGNINNLNFLENEFDCVIASEVIEHLTQSDFKKGLEEIQRVSKKYVIISVPNEDNLEKDLKMCPLCKCWFNPDYHMRSFSIKDTQNLFVGMEVMKELEIGPIKERRSYSNFGLSFLHYLKHPEPNIGICPQCGLNFSVGLGISRIERKLPKLKKKIRTILEILVRVLFTKNIHKHRWILAMYKKRDLK